MKRIENCIKIAIKKFEPNLHGKIVLTEAATGNYICTPVLAALAGAKVYAYAKESKYGSLEVISDQISTIAKLFNIGTSITIIQSLDQIDLSSVDILTNTGFLRPISKDIIEKLKPECVIPLMWEPWEFRDSELDIDACAKKGIKVYGTNESDPRLKTMDYIGFIALYFLLKEKRTPFSSSVLVVGCEKFNDAIIKTLTNNGYKTTSIISKNCNALEVSQYDSIIIAEYEYPLLIISNNEKALIKCNELNENHLIIHIAGNVSIENVKAKCYPDVPAAFKYMSYTTDYIDPSAVIDLHCAGLKVAEGMIAANMKSLNSSSYKLFMETNYPALAFDNKKYW
jgi:hypothetical protein